MLTITEAEQLRRALEVDRELSEVAVEPNDFPAGFRVVAHTVTPIDELNRALYAKRASRYGCWVIAPIGAKRLVFMPHETR